MQPLMVSVSPTQTGNRPENSDSTRRASTPAAGVSIGALLRERRVALGANLAEVEAATKIRQKYLSALEADEWQSLPGEVVGRGFLRNYAGYLGLEATEIIDRRRALADPSLSGALAPTSAGAALPPPRAVDYRPKDVDLREEPDTLEERQPPRLGPLLLIVAGVAVLIGLWWGLSRFGGSALDAITGVGSGVSDRLAGFFASNEATATPDLAVLTDTADPNAISTSVFDAGATADAAAGTTPSDAATGDAAANAPTADPALAPPAAETATPAPPTPTPEPTLPPATPTPVAQTVAVVTLANLRSSPSTDASLAGAAEVGTNVNIIGQSPDGLWFLLDSGAWIFGQLVALPTTAVPVVDPTAAAAAVAAAGGTGGATAPAEPTVDPAGAALLLPTATPVAVAEPTVATEPTAAPAPQVVAAACADPRSVIAAPGQGETVSGQVAVIGTATHENFATYKIEAGPAGGALAFMGSGNSPVQGGTLGSVDSASFGNGPLLIRLTVIDQTGNFPPPCEVTVTVAN